MALAVVVLLAMLPCAWPQATPITAGLPPPPQPETTHECTEQHPKYPDQRVCVFNNLLLFNNTVYYVSSKLTEFSPPLFISWEKFWEGHQLLDIRTVHPSQLTRLLGDAELTLVPEAGLFHQQHPNNFYHLFTEIAPTVHYTICKHLGRCSYAPGPGWADLRLFWVNRMDPSLGRQSMDYQAPPSIDELFQCFTPHPVLNIRNATMPAVPEGGSNGGASSGSPASGPAASPGGRSRAYLLRRAVAGLPRHARFYHQKKAEWQERLSDPPPLEAMASYRRRVADCLGHNFVDAVAPTNPVRITLINRHYEAGRSILNIQSLKERIQEMPEVKALGPGGAEVNVVYLSGNLREQAAVVWNSSIFMWAHGAAMAQTFFLPRGAQALELVQWTVRDPGDQHIWVQGIRRAFDLDIGLGVVVNDDRTRVFFNYEKVMAPGSQYWRMNDTEKRMLWEELRCPTWRVDERAISGATCFGWFHWGMSVVWNFELIRPKLQTALVQLHEAVTRLRRQPEGAGPQGQAAPKEEEKEIGQQQQQQQQQPLEAERMPRQPDQEHMSQETTAAAAAQNSQGDLSRSEAEPLADAQQ